MINGDISIGKAKDNSILNSLLIIDFTCGNKASFEALNESTSSLLFPGIIVKLKIWFN